MGHPKKILFVRPTLGYGGADRVTLNLLQGFDRSKYSCDLALMRAEGDFLADLPEDVKLYDLNVGSLWNMWLPLLRLIKHSNYDVVYSTCGGASMPMMLAVWLSGYKGVSVVSERNILFPPRKNRSKRKLMIRIKSLLYQRANWVTAVSKGVAMECNDVLGIKKDKTVVVHNPMVNDQLVRGAQEDLAEPFFEKHEDVILAVGRFEWQKDYDMLLQAFKKVLEKRSGTGLFILGKGPLMERYQNLAEELGIASYVCFGGFDKNPFKYFKASSVYVLSSRHEGMPGALIQAMACGIACISTDCPTGPNEVIEDGSNGFLVPVGDENLLADRINELLSNTEIRDRFEEKGPSAVLRFHEKPAIDSYFNFLTQ